MARGVDGLIQQGSVGAVSISMRRAQQIDRDKLLSEGQRQQQGAIGTPALILGRTWGESVMMPMLEKAPQREPQTLLLHLGQYQINGESRPQQVGSPCKTALPVLMDRPDQTSNTHQ